MKKSFKDVKVSVIIPTFNRLKYLYPCLLGLLNQQTNFFWEIIIIDSGTDKTEESISQLKLFYGDYLVYRKIKNSKNRARLRNLGAKIARGELLIFLDNDILVPPSFVQNHFDIYMTNPSSLVLGKRKLLTEFLPEKNINEIVLKHFNLINDLAWIIDPRDVFFGPNKSNFDENENQWRFLYSHNFSISKKKFEELNGFDEIFGNNWGYEDIELGFRYSIHSKTNKFLLLDNITGYHLPHTSQIKQSINEGFENLEVFHNIHNCFEIELNVAFCLEFDTYFTLLSEIRENPSYTKTHIFDNSNELTFGYLWGKENRKSADNKKYFGICLPFEKDNSYQRIQIINSFFLFPSEIQHSLFHEALRLASNCVCLEKDDVSLNYDLIYKIAAECGYLVEIEQDEKVYYITKKSRVTSNYLCIYLPDCFESKSRFYYEILSLCFFEYGFFMKIVDTKSKENIDNENFLLPDNERNKLNYLFYKDYGAADFQSLMPNEKMDSLANIIVDKRIVINDFPFECVLGNNKKSNKQKDIGFNLLETGLIHYLSTVEISTAQKECNKIKTVLVSVDDGFVEDNLENILQAIANLPEYKIVIKLPNYNELSRTKFVQHNQVSKENQAFSVMLKYQKDEMLVYEIIRKMKLENQTKIIKANFSLFEYYNLMNEIDTFIDVSIGMIPSPLVYIALQMRKKIIIGKHLKISDELKNSCFCVESDRKQIKEVFDLPTNIDNLLSFCFMCSSKDIELAIKGAKNSSINKDMDFIKKNQEKLYQYVNYIRK